MLYENFNVVIGKEITRSKQLIKSHKWPELTETVTIGNYFDQN